MRDIKLVKNIAVAAMFSALASVTIVNGFEHYNFIKNTGNEYVHEQHDKNTDGDKSLEKTSYTLLSDDSGYITEGAIVIETDYCIFEIEPNVYVRNDLPAVADRTCEIIESITGKSFSVKQEKMRVRVVKDNFEDGGLVKAENSYPFAMYDYIQIAPYDLFIGNSSEFIGCAASYLEQQYTNPVYVGTVLNGGFANHITYKVLKEIEEDFTDLMPYYYPSEQVLLNMAIDNTAALTSKPLEYWLEDGFYNYSSNGLFSIGFALMDFLDDEYNDCTNWFDYVGAGEDSYYRSLSNQEILSTLSMAYGDDVEEKFYSWFSDNASNYVYDYGSYITIDATEVYSTFMYPSYLWFGNETWLWGSNNNVHYKDLSINLKPLYYYLESYKGEDISKLKLVTSEEVHMITYDFDGNLMDEYESESIIRLDNVGSVLLEGEGTVQIKVIGYEQYTGSSDNRFITQVTGDIVVTDTNEIVYSLKLASTQSEPTEVRVTDNVTISGEWFKISDNVTLTVDSGCFLQIKSPVDLYGKMVYSSGDVYSVDGSVWLCDGGIIQRDDMTIRSEINAVFTDEDSVAEGFRVEDDGTNLNISGGYKTSLYFEGITKEEFDRTVNITWVRSSAKIYVNGEEIDLSDVVE